MSTCGPSRVPVLPNRAIDHDRDLPDQQIAVAEQKEQRQEREHQDGQSVQQLNAQNAGPFDDPVAVETSQ